MMYISRGSFSICRNNSAIVVVQNATPYLLSKEEGSLWLRGKNGFACVASGFNELEMLRDLENKNLIEFVTDEDTNIGKYNALNRCRIISKNNTAYIGKNGTTPDANNLMLIQELSPEAEKVYSIIEESPFPLAIAEVVKLYKDKSYTTEKAEKKAWDNIIDTIYRTLSEKGNDVMQALQEEMRNCEEIPFVVSTIEKLLKMKKIELE